MDNVIADIAQVINPNLNIVDAGDKAIIGTDALAVDIIACQLVNLDPLKVEHLKLVSEDRGEQLEDVQKNLRVIKKGLNLLAPRYQPSNGFGSPAQPW